MAISPSACSIAQTSPRDRTLANSLNRPRNLLFPDRARRRKDIDATIPDLEFDSPTFAGYLAKNLSDLLVGTRLLGN